MVRPEDDSGPVTRPTSLGRLLNGIGHIILAVGAIFMVLPILWMVSTSFKPPTEVSLWPPELIPSQPTWDNYTGIFDDAPFHVYFLNSVGYSLVATISVMVTSLLAGAIFGKYNFPGRVFLFMVIIATAIVPFEAYIIPLYIQIIDLDWVNTPQGIVLPTLFLSFGVFLLRQHVSSAIPTELLEAGRVDGASEWWILRRVITPLSAPALSAIGIFAFIQAWGAFFWPLIVANDQDLFNMELGLQIFQFRFSADYGKLMAGSVISTLPMLIAFLVLRRRIIESVALSGLKG
ncbi:MAG: carbohydrate ABC transporter permease [Proteobacteria bacterium]|nr:carbohydrate ABC transporter permease [Pseudomonadota bacterium]MBI3498632.1 carbohydrate ABC transporter permease [Pseudomonadota bacterium]